MSHAILVIGYGNHADILKQTLQVLNDKDIDFYIHWDKRYSLPDLDSVNIAGKVIFIKSRIAVKWGSYTQIKALLLLLKNFDYTKYDYIHLISSNDLPLMTSEYFKKYFSSDFYIGFHDPVTQVDINRLRYVYPNNIDFRKHKVIAKAVWYINKLFHINKLKKFNIKNIKKGPQWFSLKSKYVPGILNYKDQNIFKNCYCGDELFIQTIFHGCDNKKHIKDDNAEAARYIDWNRGEPYTFKDTDISELKGKINSDFAFVRKIDDVRIGKELFDL
ncbi:MULTISPECIES: beta-1,6-N-acetylglucosaminyltransferase [unclassified Lactobacillus]|uniref:beta-1,6-N-acetylglucosaminyltransferase n=1 Tax=unclassified Lactobacillus TaxID=2620435 RepID=UPI000BEED550|nr:MULTISPECIES: beta-1,6-N-acetylglucosaminyltransferase [unclassified Lactobacillus]PEG86525.1 hypothetical protein CP365_07430 [Lactobacillus sp. UMNPBX14]PEH02073.1 hypothetical protein CP357_07440 [Lactobacillus sp. UMNPBX6]